MCFSTNSSFQQQINNIFDLDYGVYVPYMYLQEFVYIYIYNYYYPVSVLIYYQSYILLKSQQFLLYCFYIHNLH